MAYKPKAWPHNALWALEDVQAVLMDIERLANEVQEAAKEGNKLEAVIVAGNIRTKSMMAHSTLVRAKAGDYEGQ